MGLVLPCQNDVPLQGKLQPAFSEAVRRGAVYRCARDLGFEIGFPRLLPLPTHCL